MAIKFLSAIDQGAYQLPSVDGSAGQVLTTDGSGNVTFQSVAASANYYLSGASFNTGNGVLTLTVSGAANQTVDLDGRYALSSHTHSYDNYQSWNLKTNGIQRTTVQSGGTLDLVAGSNVSLSYGAGGVVTIASTDTNTDTNDIDYINAASFNTSTGVITGTGVGNAGFTVDIDGRYLPLAGGTITGNLQVNGYIKSNGQQLVLNAGESAGYATGQTSEIVYINAEAGLEILSSPDNWSTGWAGRNSAYINRADATSYLPGTLTVNGHGNSSQWNTAYGWGDHASAGYQPAGNYFTDGDTVLNMANNDGFVYDDTTNTMYVKLDGTNREIYHTGIFTDNSANWNTAYSWGNHASAGYLTSYTDTDNYVDSVAFNTTTGVLTLGRTGALTDLTVDLDGRYQGAGTYNTIIGTDSDISATGATVISAINMTDGVIQSHSTRTLTLANLGYTGSATADDYGGWRISDSSNTEVIGAGDTLTVVGAGAANVQYDTSTNTLTITSTDTNTNTTYSAGSGLSLSGTTFSHADTSSQSSVNNGGRTYIQDITLDTYGHITGIVSATETVTNTDTITRVGTSGNEASGTITLIAGGATTISQSGTSITISSTDTNTDTNNYLTGASFSTSNGILTLTRQGLGDITVDLDGRFTDNGYADALNQHLRTSDSPSFAGMTINGNLTVTGTTVTDQVEVVSTSTGILFEGSAADAYEGLLLAGTLTADRTYTLPNATGTVALTSDIPTVNNATLTVQGTGILSGSGTFTANASSNATISISHNDTSTLNGAYGGSNNGVVIEDITVDAYGHVTAIGTRDLDGRFDNYGGWRISDTVTTELLGAGATLNVVGAGASTVQYDASTNTLTITSTDTNTDTNTTYSAGSGLTLTGTTFSHTDTSSASSVNNSGRTYIQDITIDTYGHVTGISSATETVTNTDTNYYLNGASFNTSDGVLTLTVSGTSNQTVDLDGRYQLAGTYNTIIGTDSDINTSGATIIDNIYVTDGVITSMGTRTLTPGDIGAAYYDHFRSLGTTAFTAGGGSNSSITTDQLISEMEGDGAFDSYTSTFKTSWSYAGNDNLSNAGNFTETAGTSWLTWTDDSSDSTRGNITALAIAPNTGGSAYGVYIYNDQGSGYSPGWREVWTDKTLNPIVSATVSNDTTTYVKADGSSFSLTTSDANSNTYVTGASFNTGDGVLTLTRNSGSVTVDLDGRYQLAGTYNTIIGTDTDIDTSGATIIDNIYMTDGVITSHGTRTLTLANLGYTGATNADAYGGWRISDGATTELLGAGATLTVNGTGATTAIYDAATNTLTINSTDTNTNTTYSAGNGISLSGTTFSVAAGTGLSQTSTGLALATAGAGAGTYGSTGNGTKIDTITLDAYGRITAVATGATGDILGVTAGTGLSGGGTSGTVTVSLSHLGLESLGDPNADRVAFWDDSAGAFKWLTMGSNLSISGTTLNATDTNTNTTYTAGGGLTLSGTTFSHTDTSSQASVNNSGNTVIQDITVDTYGHITGLASKTLTLSGLGYTGASNADLYNYWTIDAGGQQTNVTTQSIITFVGTGATNVQYDPVLKQLTIDSTDTNTNTTYSADGNYGLTLSGTTFRLEDDRRRNSSTTDIYTGNTHDYTFYDASIGIRWYTAGAEEMRLQDNGTLHVDGDVVAYSSTVSDRTFKDDIVTITDAIDKVKKLRGVEYVWNSGYRKGKKDLGLIAQEVQEVLPEIVHEHEMPLMEDAEAGKTYKTVDYEKMVGVLIEAMKDQQVMIDTLTAKLETLEKNFNSRL